MKKKNNIISFSDEITDVVNSLNTQFLKEGKLCTNPDMLHFHSYCAYDLTNDKTPDFSISKFTIDGLKSIFPLIDINLGENDEIIVEGIVLENYTAFIDVNHVDHIEYIKNIMLDIFLIYEKDETKIPPKLYKWYFEKK